MIELSRTVRFAVNPGRAYAPHEPDSGNGFAGRPSMVGLGRYYELEVSTLGEIDPATGYFMPIDQVDRAVRAAAVPLIARACHDAPQTDPAALLPDLLSSVSEALGGRLRAMRWWLTPYYSVEMTTQDTNSVLLRQRFDFAAAHRLHSADLSDDENRRLFGKCNNPNYHGHNYRLEPVVAVRLTNDGPSFTLQQLERLVGQKILDQLDHRNLNLDIEEFARASGANPSVENIAQVCFERLAPEIERAANGAATLEYVTVWETDRTSCTYPA